jgi:opacity protein-like surface antigen
MKRNYLLPIISCLAISLYSVSCKKYLDERVNNNITTPSTISDLQALLDNATKLNLNNTSAFGQVSDDDYFLLSSSLTSLSASIQNAYKHIPFDYFFANDWSVCYQTIYTTNTCLEIINKIDRTPQNAIAWDNIKGSALFFRAFNFLNLSWNYAKAFDENSSQNDLGIVLRIGTDFNIPSARSTAKQSYEQVISDAKQAISYLPDNSAHVFRPSKPAAYALLARAYLSMRVYDSALKYSNLSLSLKSNLLDYKSSINANASAPFTQKYNNPEIVFYTETYVNWIASPAFATSRALVDTTLFATYESTDVR